MPLPEILVCANGPGLLESRIKIALQIAGRLRSHIQVAFFRAAQNPSTVPTYAPAFNYSPQRGLAESVWDKDLAELARAKAIYDRLVTSKGCWIGQAAGLR